MSVLINLIRPWGAVASWLVHLSPDRAVWVWALAGDILLCSGARHVTLTVHEWVPLTFMRLLLLQNCCIALIKRGLWKVFQMAQQKKYLLCVQGLVKKSWKMGWAGVEREWVIRFLAPCMVGRSIFSYSWAVGHPILWLIKVLNHWNSKPSIFNFVCFKIIKPFLLLYKTKNSQSISVSLHTRISRYV